MSAISMEEARKILLSEIKQQEEWESCAIYQATGRIVKRQYVAQINQPPFDRSPLDGFALCHEDATDATAEHPVTLRITQRIYAGDDFRVALRRGEAARIMTGAGIPEGADCVIRQEEVTYDADSVTIYAPLRKHDNICDKGEDMAIGESIIECGEIVTPAHGAALAGQGYFTLEVYKRRKVGILATGSELTEQEISPGQIYNSNTPMIAMRLEELGIQTIPEYCGDAIEEIADRIRKLLTQCDMVITTGGVSVGEKDYLPQVVERLDGTVLFHGVAMKPGSPMLTARIADKMLICLSGNPFAAMATLELIVLPGLLKATGRRCYYPTLKEARLANAFPKASKHGRRFIRALWQDGVVSVPSNHSSGSIANMIHCNCLIDIPAGTGCLEAGKKVNCILFLKDENALPSIPQTYNEMPLIFCICGAKNTGKTTIMEQMVKELTNRGYRVGVIKHDGHDFIPDVPATDSFRAREAGAQAVAVYSSRRTLFYKQHDGEAGQAREEQLLKEFSQFVDRKPDILLIEGWKNSAYPKIEVVRKAISKACIASEPVCAICSDLEQEEVEHNGQNCPIYRLEQIQELVDWVLSQGKTQ